MYDLSKDYDKLYKLVREGNKVIGFVDYEHCRDACVIKQRNSGDIDFGVRGHSYSWLDSADTKEHFLKICNVLNVEWIQP